jgi:alkanesulfonate monooxygenase SsuD/methylene tetrahydromethanopterin reductase-like flavin-dependent oxidoreductase (luciferase family)
MPAPTREAVATMRDLGSAIGTPDDAIRSVKRWADAGVDGLIIPVGHLGHDHAMKTIELFGKYIIPEFDGDPIHRTKRFRDAAKR